MKVMVAGGGIGGCALALSLHDAGITDIEVFESVAKVRELGVGINVLPHAVRDLAELGLLDDLVPRAVGTSELGYYNRHGQRIWVEPRGLAAGYRWPQLSIHRGELLGVLHRAVLDRLGAPRYRTGHHLVGFTQDGKRVRATFSDRRTGAPVAQTEADVLVACDGVHSTVRAALYPDEGPPLWNGITMWRGVTVSSPFLTGRTMIMAGVLACRMVVYPIKDLPDGGQLLNWVAEVKVTDGRPMPKQDWDFEAAVDAVLPHFGTFNFDWLNVPELIRGCERVLQYPMVDRDPLPRWTSGRVTLLGDAAHPMYPVGSNGASQAILDARVLARELALAPSVAEALTAYEQQRRPATSAVVLANRQVGPERCMELVDQRAPDGFTNIFDVISREELEEIALSYKQTAGFDSAAVNERPSLSVRR
ncbi:MAG TPA: flavin-dependent oxidoreductase [Gemmataceae bacterium]|jgi:2-polyprenyl-6-methoxyphenol hydroxylase-like FAD-dependent oxidoreductase|nr:flavin-dependent oxidoreductase [Gemmataceae bacterium]